MTPWVCMGWVSIDVHAMHSNTEPHNFFEGFFGGKHDFTLQDGTRHIVNQQHENVLITMKA